MFKKYNDNDFVINYQDDLEKLVTNFVSYYKKNINALFNKFHLKNIKKMEIRLFSDKSLLGDIPYKLGEPRKGKGKRYKEGKIVAIYTNFVLVEFETKYNENYRECFKISEIII